MQLLRIWSAIEDETIDIETAEEDIQSWSDYKHKQKSNGYEIEILRWPNLTYIQYNTVYG